MSTEQQVTALGKGAAAVIWMPRGPDWQSLPIRILRITGTGEELGMNAHGYELLGLTVGLKMSSPIPAYIPMMSDCTGALARATDALSGKKNALVPRKFGATQECIRNLTKCCKRPLGHVTGHPERRTTDKSKWTRKDFGIFFADKAAEKQYGSIRECLTGGPNQLIIQDISMEGLMDELMPEGMWHLRFKDSGKQVLQEIKAIPMESRLTRYIKERDLNRASRGLPAYWQGTSLALAAACHKTSGGSIWDHARNSKRILDRGAHGRNLAKAAKSVEEKADLEMCVVCGLQDSQRHQLMECRHQDFTHIREFAKDTQETLLAEFLAGKGPVAWPTTWMRSLARAFVSSCWVRDFPELERLWVGTWTEDTLHSLCKINLDTADRITPLQRRDTIKIISSLTGPLITAMTALLRARMGVISVTKKSDIPLYRLKQRKVAGKRKPVPKWAPPHYHITKFFTGTTKSKPVPYGRKKKARKNPLRRRGPPGLEIDTGQVTITELQKWRTHDSARTGVIRVSPLESVVSTRLTGEDEDEDTGMPLPTEVGAH